MPLPMPRPISGRRFAPKIRMMMARIIRSSGSPTLPSMVLPFGYKERLDSIIFSRLALLAAALVGCTVAAGAQFTSGVNVVEVYAAVVDQNGNPIAGLARGDFSILEDGRPQTISTFTEGDFPLSVALGVDRSFSMASRGRQAPLPSVTAARTFLSALRPQDESMVVAIGSEVEIAAPLSTNRSAQMAMLASLEPWGTTGLHDAIIAALDAIQAA